MALASPADLLAGPAEDGFRDHVAPFLKQYCADCHAGEAAEGGLNVEKYTSVATTKADLKHWQSIRTYVGGRIMPPADTTQPKQAESNAFLAWIDTHLLALDCDSPKAPAQVTVRRLNRTEYNNTIRDLFGIDFEPADDFPSDDIGYGFDNIADVLSLPPILLEKYLNAAEQVTLRAIVTRETATPVKERFQGGRLRVSTNQRLRGSDVASLSSTSHVDAEHRFEDAGEYVVRIRAHADQAGDEPAKMKLSIDGKEQHIFDVSNENRAGENFEQRITLEPGKRRITAAFINDYYEPNNPNPRRRDRNLFVHWIEVEGPLDISGQFDKPSHKRIIPYSPQPGQEKRAAAEMLRAFVRKAYRRPPTDSEIQRLVSLVEMVRGHGDSFERGMQLAVQAVLVSPHFIFRVERDPTKAEAGKAYRLSDHELAARLSYFLWSSTPDDELSRLADQGKLHDLAVLDTQVNRMLRDERSQALVENFGSQWLTLRALDGTAPDPQVFRDYSPDLKADMRRETELFFAHIMREDRPLYDFLDADYTFVNERLAKHYGMSGVSGGEFRKVTLNDGRRGGIVTQGSFLTVTSNPQRTSPVKRGKWILEQLLGTPPPPPPPDVPELEASAKDHKNLSLREQMALHSENPSCANCHVLMDPLGLALENYNAVGSWRDRDGKHEVDARGELPSGEKFSGAKGLKEVLMSKKKDFLRAFSEKMMTYALGRGLVFDDRCTIEEIVERVEDDGATFSRMVREVVRSDPFRMRTATGGGL
jgi:hypothetical protein